MTRPLTIGIVTATYPPSSNGVATSTALYARGLQALGHRVRVFAPRHPQQHRREDWQEDAGGAEVYRLRTSFRAARFLGAPPDYPVLLHPGAIARTLPLDDIDVFHTMHPFLAGRLAREWAARPSRIGSGRAGGPAPVIYTAHTQYDEYLHYSPVPPLLAGRAMQQHVARFASRVSRVLAPGQAMIDMLRRYGYGGPVQIFPNPADLSAFVDSAGGPLSGAGFRAQFGLQEGEPLAMYLGRLAPEKNLDTLLAAFALARAQRPALRLALVGGGPSSAALAAKLPQGALLTGPLPYAQVPLALAAADAFVTASTSEVLPMSMIEALAARTPLVAAHSPAALDLVQHGINGTVTDANAEALAAGLLWALDAERLPTLRAGAWASAQQYDLSVRAQALAEVYAEAIAEAQAGGTQGGTRVQAAKTPTK